ncbi:MAG: sugar ABC transporter permease [Streptomycetaceae bacterium]|nr:MAG: sugar ABC transporter permease [Streptomycetaceae bacterium]
MAAPAALLYGFLYLYPAVSNLLYSTQRWDGVTKPEFVGLHNFKYLIANDLTFHKIVGNNIRFSFIVVILQTLFSLLFAIFLVKNTKSNIFLRTVFFFPTILSSVSVGLIWTFLYNPNFGFINATLKSLGLNSLALNWLSDARFSLYSVAIAQIWFHTGQMVVIYLAGLQQIPQELYESAEVDGASRWHQFRYVTWPMALPTTAVVVAYTTIQTFRAFDLVYSMTQGGPMNSSDLIVTNIFNMAFGAYKFGYASAESVILIIFVLVITWIQRRTLRVKGGEK